MHGGSILTTCTIIYFSEVLESATRNKYTERRLWCGGLGGKCSYNIERVHIGLIANYMVHDVALNCRVASK